MFSMSYKLSKHLDRFEVYGTSQYIVSIKYIKQKEFVNLKSVNLQFWYTKNYKIFYIMLQTRWERLYGKKKSAKNLEYASKEGSPFFLASFSVFNRLSIRENDNNPRPEVS